MKSPITYLSSKLKRFRKEDEELDGGEAVRPTESQSSYMQHKRNIYVNMKLPPSEYDDEGQRIDRHFVSNRVRTAKYTPISFLPKNLFEQFRNIANLYFLFLVILQFIPLFAVSKTGLAAMPLAFILTLTGTKDAIEDLRRNKSDNKVNNSTTLRLSNWNNVNIPEFKKGRSYYLSLVLGFFSVLSGTENTHAYLYRQARSNRSYGSNKKLPPTSDQPAKSDQPTISEHPYQNTLAENDHHYRPGSVPHSVLYRSNTRESVHLNQDELENEAPNCAGLFPQDPPAKNCQVRWESVKWKDVIIGDYIKIENNQVIPADVVILSTSETDNVCYTETQNLDGETNLKQRQGLPSTADLVTEHDCERASFYIESEPPHVNIYQYNAVLRWHVDADEVATIRSGVQHEKADAINYNNILLRGCILRNTKWVIGVVVYTGNDTKIMLNSGKTPSKRSKIAKATNPHVISNFCLLAIISLITSIMKSAEFNAPGSARFFDNGIEGNNAAFSGFLTFWVSLILYQNIVPISLYISVEIVKTVAAIFIFADLKMYHEPTDTPCIVNTWSISDDLGQIEYIFSDKTGTLTQNKMEYRKCTINGVTYGYAPSDITLADIEKKKDPLLSGTQTEEVSTLDKEDHETGITLETTSETASLDNSPEGLVLEELKKDMFKKQAELFNNPYVSPDCTFVDPKLFDDLASESKQSAAATHFFQSLALCHTVIADRPDEDNPNMIEYKAQSPDEAALVGTARDMGFVFLGRDSNKLFLNIKGVEKTFILLNVLEFNSTRKRMSVIVKPIDSDHIVLLCKGADSVIYERLCTDFGDQKGLAEEQRVLIESTSSDLERFACEGLRTLCLAYRFISPEEYKPWNRKFQEAAASIQNRDERVEEVCEEIEKNMLLMGGTAIEDKLQDGVPETIAELATSGIKLWVLTGDKTETAINIGYSCNLLTPEMELLILRADNREDTFKVLSDALEKLNRELPYSDDKRYALVIDGVTLKYGLEEETKNMVLAIGTRCASVICCRVSPKQKAQVVRLVKKGLNVMTLAIGDGANDVSMIQEANVGVGISGVEGRQAAMASDYAFAQFRYLRRLLLVHGRWSYLRMSEMIMGFFFKNVVWTFVLFWYQIFCQFNGSMIFDYALITLYNLIFTCYPIVCLGIWDQDLKAEVSLKYPELYRMGLRNDKFKKRRFWLTIVDAIFQSAVCFFFPYMLLVGGAVDSNGFDSNGLYEIGTIISSITVTVANLYVVFAIYSHTWIQAAIFAFSICFYYLFVTIYSQFNTFLFMGQVRLFGSGSYWLMLILTIVACFIPRVAASHYLHAYKPYDNDIIREIEMLANKNEDKNDTLSQEAEPKLL
ncbi:hypothetical protein BDB01DRAFT_794086 [Pilobolus umbonatus]|nr:hypothetical protein BDB01DRAFT_794086 [Pilobolus umbonatus]